MIASTRWKYIEFRSHLRHFYTGIGIEDLKSRDRLLILAINATIRIKGNLFLVNEPLVRLLYYRLEIWWAAYIFTCLWCRCPHPLLPTEPTVRHLKWEALRKYFMSELLPPMNTDGIRGYETRFSKPDSIWCSDLDVVEILDPWRHIGWAEWFASVTVGVEPQTTVLPRSRLCGSSASIPI